MFFQMFAQERKFLPDILFETQIRQLVGKMENFGNLFKDTQVIGF